MSNGKNGKVYTPLIELISSKPAFHRMYDENDADFRERILEKLQSDSKPKIFCYSAVEGGGEGMAFALAEDGKVLGGHFCTHEGFIPGDLGVTPGSRPDRHEVYATHYPDGYEMVFIPHHDLEEHAEFLKAYKLNLNPKGVMDDD